MVWTLAVTETVGFGVLYYSFAVLVVPMRESLRTSTGMLSGAFSFGLAVNGLAAVAAGRWIDRHGTRALMATGSVVGALAVVGWSRAGDLPELYASFAGVGLASAMVLYEPAFALVNTWFDRDRASALLAVTVVAGFASTIFLPTTQALVDALGWRTALLVLAALVGACAVPHALVLRRRPGDVGLGVDGVSPAAQRDHGQVAPADPAAVRGAWRMSAVRWLTAATVAETVAVTIVGVDLVAYLRDTGARPTVAALTAGAIGVLSVTGRVVLTSLARRVGLGRLTAAMVGAQAAGVAALVWLARPAGVVVFVVLFGGGFGVMTIARAALLGTYVPAPVFASVSGGQALASNVARVAAPLAAGALIAGIGYGAAFALVAGGAVVAALALLLAERRHGAAHGRSRVPERLATESD